MIPFGDLPSEGLFPKSIQHLRLRLPWNMDYELENALKIINSLPRLKMVSWTYRMGTIFGEDFQRVREVCVGRGIEVVEEELMPGLAPIMEEDMIPVDRFPRVKSVLNYARMV